MTAAWLPGEALAFDTETTGPDPLTARIVTADTVIVGPNGARDARSWLVNPGVEIPAEATAIHGITNEQARTGLPLSTATVQIANEILLAWKRGLPLIAMNASFDLTVLNQCLCPLDRFEQIGPVLDPKVIDRGLDPYRKGKRTLTDLADHYKVRLEGAHTSAGDALAAARIIWAMATNRKEIRNLTLEEMQLWQAAAHAKWAIQFRSYLRENNKPADVESNWLSRSAA